MERAAASSSSSQASLARLLEDAATRLDAAGIDDARLEAEVLAAHALRVDRAHVLAALREPIPDASREAFARLLDRRFRREPLAYITGRREFFGIDVACGPGALIPRPETELLVEVVLEEAQRRPGTTRVVDVGCGTGAIAVAVARNAPSLRIVAVDSSTAALALARRNVERLGLGERVEVCEGDLLEGLGTFDVIIANLPYVREGEWDGLVPEIREWEPREALVAGPRGTEAIDRLLRRATVHLAPAGVLAVEFGDGQARELSAVAVACFPDGAVSVKKDLAGLERVLVVCTREAA